MATSARMKELLKLLRVGKKPSEELLHELCRRCRESFLSQNVMVEVGAPTNIVGDMHGQFLDLLMIFDKCGWPPNQHYLFLGDYVDRGPQSVETVSLLMAFKLLHPDSVFLLRGNHETASVNKRYGFLDECTRKYSTALYRLFDEAFCCMPLCALVQGKLLCMHGGISPELTSWDVLTRIERPVGMPDSGVICDLLWSDPDKDVTGWVASPRGCSYEFGVDVVNKFCDKMNIDGIVRGHQVAQTGYNFFAERQVVTVFSAPNYCNKYNNTGAVMLVDADLKCSFHTFEPKKSSFFSK